MAFEHLATAPVAHPDLTVCLWDTAGTGRSLPDLDWNLIHKNGYRGHNEGSFYFHFFDSIDALSALDAQRGLAYYVVRDCHALPWWIDASPLQALLHAWLRERGLQLTHTAAVGNEHGAALLCGKGGSGKSTTVLACLRAGMEYLAEDYCILEPGAIPRAYSIYQSAKWERHTRRLFPHYEGFIRNGVEAETEKALVYYREIFPGQIRVGLPLRALVSLSVGPADQPVIESCEKTQALKDLMMSTLLQLPFYHPRTTALLSEVASQVPLYRLTLGRDLDANVSVIKGLLA